MVKIIFGLLLSASVVCHADYAFDKDSGLVEFKAKGWPSLLKINGKAEGATGKLIEDKGKVSGTLSLNLASLKTGIDLRDEHLKNNYLKIKEEGRGEAKITISDVVLPKNNKGSVKIKAKLELNKVTKDVLISGKLKPNKKGFEIKAGFEFKITDFKIDIPSFKGITVAEDVKVKVNLKALKL